MNFQIFAFMVVPSSLNVNSYFGKAQKILHSHKLIANMLRGAYSLEIISTAPSLPTKNSIICRSIQREIWKQKYILIEHNLRLVAHVVKKYQHLSEDTEDLISIGTIGLIKAVMTFNPDKGVRLATYAARCIENELLMLMRSRKKVSGEVSLYEPIGTDKEGNEIRLFDIMESESTGSG